MRKTFFILIICIFSSCISGSYVCSESDIYKEVNNIVNFHESGMKISYKTSSNIKEILQEINDLNLYYLNSTLKIENDMENDFNFEKKDDKSSIKVLIGKDINSYNVEIEIIDKEKLVDINKIKLKCGRLNHISNINYYTFIKGKVKKECGYELEKKLFNILDCYNIQNKSNILLENGLTGKFTVQKKFKINYSIMNYNDGTYLIVGSPIIFITY